MSVQLTPSGLLFPDSSLQVTGFNGYKNRLINGNFAINQRFAQISGAGTSAYQGSVSSSSSAISYQCPDRWFGAASGGITSAYYQRVAGSGNVPYYLQMTGPSGISSMGVGQRIEAKNSYDLAGQTVTLSISASVSGASSTTLTWYVSYPVSTDNFGSSPSGSQLTQIATGNWTIGNTMSQYSAQISIPSAATTGLQVYFATGSMTGLTINLSQAQLEKGSAVSSFDVRPYPVELQLCQRYFCQYMWAPNTSGGGYPLDLVVGATYAGNANYDALVFCAFPVLMRAQPSWVNPYPGGNISHTIYSFNATQSSVAYRVYSAGGSTVLLNNTDRTATLGFSSLATSSGTMYINSPMSYWSGGAGAGTVWGFDAEL